MQCPICAILFLSVNVYIGGFVSVGKKNLKKVAKKNSKSGLAKLELFKKDVLKKFDKNFSDDGVYWLNELNQDLELFIEEKVLDDYLSDFIYETEEELQEIIDSISNKKNEKKLVDYQDEFILDLKESILNKFYTAGKWWKK